MIERKLLGCPSDVSVKQLGLEPNEETHLGLLVLTRRGHSLTVDGKKLTSGLGRSRVFYGLPHLPLVQFLVYILRSLQEAYPGGNVVNSQDAT